MGRGRSSVECRLALGFLSTCPVCFSILFCLVLSCPVLLCVCPPDHDHETTVLPLKGCARCVSLSNCFCCVVLFYHISVCLCLSVCLSSARAQVLACLQERIGTAASGGAPPTDHLVPCACASRSCAAAQPAPNSGRSQAACASSRSRLCRASTAPVQICSGRDTHGEPCSWPSPG